MRFFYYNLWLGYSDHFGTYPWHWYLNTGLPVMLGLFTFPLLALILQMAFSSPRASFHVRNHSNSSLVVLRITLVFFIIGLSLIRHKEFRFLLPILPLAHILIGNYLHHIESKCGSPKFVRRFLVVSSLIHLVVALYLGLYHQVLLYHQYYCRQWLFKGWNRSCISCTCKNYIRRYNGMNCFIECDDNRGRCYRW